MADGFGSLFQTFANNPESILSLLGYLQILVHFGFVMFFGWIIMIGWKTYNGFLVKFALRLAFGLVALICGIGLSGIIGGLIFSDPTAAMIVKLMQLDVMLSGLVCSFILLFSVYMISSNIHNINGMKNAVDKLEKRISSAEELVKKTGRSVNLKSPLFIAGVVIMVALLAFALLNFRGYPSISGELFSALGVNQTDMTVQPGAPAGCISPMSLLMKNAGKIQNGELQAYTNPDLKAKIETGGGHPIEYMAQVDQDGKNYVLAISSDQYVCVATMTDFCSCMDISQYLNMG